MATPVEELNILLSREELVFLLFLLKVDFIPGLDADPLGNLSKEQKNLGLAYAERSLRARGLVSIDEKGELVVREALLLMVGTCAYPELMISIHHFPTKIPPSQVYWNAKSGVAVAHTRPDAPLHGFGFIKDRNTLVQQILDSCQLVSDNKPSLPVIVTTNLMLKIAREGSVKDFPGTVKKLISSGIDPGSAQELCKVLATDHSVSALHLVSQKPNSPPLQESVTVLSGQSSTWLMMNGKEDNVSLTATSKIEISEFLLGWTGLDPNLAEISAN